MKWLTGYSGLAALVLGLFGISLPLLYGWNSALIQWYAGAHLTVAVVLFISWVMGMGAETFSRAGEVAVRRNSRFLFVLTISIVGFVGVLAVVNILAHRHDRRWDLSEEGVYSLAPQSRQVMRDLKLPLRMVAFRGNERVPDEEIQRLFDLYRYENKERVQTELVNPRTKPHLVERYEMKPGNVIYLEYGEGEQKAVSRINEATEEEITNSVLRLARGQAKKIYVVEGHSGPSMADSSPAGLQEFQSALKDDHFSVEGLALASKDAIPSDAAAVLLVNPARALLQNERDMLVSYVNGGGRLLLVTDVQSPPDVRDLAAQFGIEVKRDVVLDRVPRVIGGSPAHLVTRNWGQHGITKAMDQNNVVLFRLAASVDKKPDAPAGATVAEIVKSEDSTWGETNLDAIFNSDQPEAALEPDDRKGPVPLAMAYEKNLDSAPQGEADSTQTGADFKRSARVVVVGDADWVLNENLPVLSNRDFALNVVNWLVGEEGGISIRPRSIRASFTRISADSFQSIFGFSILLPEIFLLLGLLVWWRRRSVEN